MSPVTLRRYRAERLLRREFAGMQTRVIGVVAARLRGCGVTLDEGDLEACYAVAWQGLYMAMLEGQEVTNPVGWLVLVTFRRAIEESRSRGRIERGARVDGVGADDAASALHSRSASGEECDLAAELDDRTRLRHLFEGLRTRLGEREREAAVLCYLQGLPRAEAAARMGVSDARMRKLMDGAGDGNPGVAGKVGALVRSIRDGDWCEEQGSLMRALAFGILDPAGERYQLALAHRGECPACRAYVVSLRGLAAALPPTLLPWGVGGGVLARLGEGAHASATGAGATGASTGGAGAGSAPALGGAAGGSAAGGAVAGGGAAGGGWLLAGGPLGAKLAVGCVLAVGVGAGCAALEGGLLTGRTHGRRHGSAPRAAAASLPRSRSGLVSADAAAAPTSPGAPAVAHSAAGVPIASTARASREFGPEQSAAAGAASSASASSARLHRLARAASSSQGAAVPRSESGGGAAGASAPLSASSSVASAAPTPAAREFSPG